ncbi:MAG TPA: carbohydrate ABC transporter permease [Methylomirabilota bacterium]
MFDQRISPRSLLAGAVGSTALLTLPWPAAPAVKKGTSLRIWILKTYVEPTNKAIEASVQRWAQKNGASVTGFFKALPDELEEAALIDGAGRITAFLRVLLPLAAPGLVASAIFAFTLSWNEFLYALVFIQDEKAITVPVGLNLLIYGDVFHWGQLMAASVITTIPVVALYVFIHRWMVEGLVAGSVKG